jgi:hypothetical protein
MLRFTHILIKACKSIRELIQKAEYLAKRSVTLVAILNHLYHMNKYKNNKIVHQINHNSSTTTEYIKSHCTSGKYQNF